MDAVQTVLRHRWVMAGQRRAKFHRTPISADHAEQLLAVCKASLVDRVNMWDEITGKSKQHKHNLWDEW